MGDATVLGLLMRRLHRRFTHVPWRVVGKEISVEDVRHALGWLPDRFAEHPELVFVVTNLPLLRCHPACVEAVTSAGVPTR